MKPQDEALVTKLQGIMTFRSPTDFSIAKDAITRRDIIDILAYLDPPEIDPNDAMFRDAKGDKVSIDDWVEFTDLSLNADWAGRFALVVGLSDKHNENVLIVRCSGETRVRKIYPSKVTLSKVPS